MADTDTQDITKEEAEMMAQWENDSEAESQSDFDSGGDDDDDTRILNQDEIDSLLGFDDADEGNHTSGVMA